MTDETEVEEPYIIADLDEAECREIARNWVMNKLWFPPDDMSPQDIRMVFLPIALGAHIPQNIGMVYGDLRDSLDRSVNGMPIFMSCKFLSQESWRTVLMHGQLMYEALQ